MALRGKKPTTIEKRLKALWFGSAGSGKTTAAIQFPRPYLIDTERGAENDQYVELLDSVGGSYFPTCDFDEMVAEIRALLTEQHDFRTLIIDPLTVLYADLIDKAEKKVGTEHGRHYGEANKQMKHLTNLLLRLDMNVIITSHAKLNYGPNMTVLGETFDCYKKLDYLFDLVFEVQKRGKERTGIIRKTRVKGFPDGETFPFSYDEIANRYGRDLLEKRSEPQQLATPEQAEEITALLADRKDGPELQEKWLDKAKAETWAEMPADVMEKCIDWLKNPAKKGVAA